MVLDIPNSIREFNDAVSEVFTKVSSVLSQFRIYERLDKVDNLLARQIHLVMMSFVKICAHVVSYQQGSHWERLVKYAKNPVPERHRLTDQQADEGFSERRLGSWRRADQV